ncbi:MAG: hypothetical protein JWN55_448 [Frankiales bacterium]|nr:hypothetical protein [Frankiales bacterium]
MADAAYRWAQEIVRPGQRTRNGLIGALIAVIDGSAVGGWLGMGLAEQRAAKRILRAHAAKE